MSQVFATRPQQLPATAVRGGRSDQDWNVDTVPIGRVALTIGSNEDCGDTQAPNNEPMASHGQFV